MHEVRAAGPADAGAIGALHADSWRRHYRGAFADHFLDGDVVTDRRELWAARLAEPGRSETFLLEDAEGVAGFVHVIFDRDPRWGSFVDNLHVRNDLRRGGLGSVLLTHAGRAVREHAASPATYLWVLAQNEPARRFYERLGGVPVEHGTASDPGGVPGRLNGAPPTLRMAWPEGVG
ncbi:hypothetical protein SRB5_58560 [Streptomyces sp. RB5]|uniref:N-acetyltransferase domain-containing protein n=1 Tax=Streptomyces smaragdinus TaxID=2585196 RepID=A0A7K0CQA3_9ACTN|nr:GNAT family N-acetyltransferase [Streptomyces smaragdinus]MQY15668.1 hypothetical protein [Streptomyces smaragdinus]